MFKLRLRKRKEAERTNLKRYMPTFHEEMPYNLGEISMNKKRKSDNTLLVSEGTPIPLIQWKHLFDTCSYDASCDWSRKSIIKEVLTESYNPPPSSTEVWDGIGIFFGGGKESLLSLCMLNEITDQLIHVFTMGEVIENETIVENLKIFKKMGMNIEIHTGDLNGNTTWGQLMSGILLCAKYKIGTMFYCSEIAFDMIDKNTRVVSKYYCCGVEMLKFATKAMHKCGWPITFSSLVSPITGWNAMHILHHRYPEYAKYMMSYLPGMSPTNLKKFKCMVWAESMGVTIDDDQKDAIDRLKNGDLTNPQWRCIRNSKLYGFGETRNSLFRLKLIPKYGEIHPYVESPMLEYKDFIPERFRNECWNILVKESLRGPMNAGKIYGNITLKPIDMTKRFNRSIENIEYEVRI